MSKVIDIKDSAKADCGNLAKKENLAQATALVLDQFKQIAIDKPVQADYTPEALAAGWNFFIRLRNDQPAADKKSKGNFNTFHGLRFYLDERIPPNQCDVRNKFGETIQSFTL